jgi:dienelactone hydrolase
MKFHCTRLLIGLVTALGFISNTTAFSIQPKSRPMTIRDLLQISSITACVLSPDEQWLAVAVQNPRSEFKQFSSAVSGNYRSDVWLISINGRTRTNITANKSKGLGFWLPAWSPDSQQLALLATDGHNSVRPFVYDLSSKRLRPLSSRNVDLAMSIRTDQDESSSLVWLDRDRLVLGLLPIGIRPLQLDELERTTRIESRAIDAVARGDEVTANMISSEMGSMNRSLAQSLSLTEINVHTNAQRSLAEIPLHEGRLSQRVVTFSPTLKYAVILATQEDTQTKPVSMAPPELASLFPIRVGVTSIASSTQQIQWFKHLRPSLFTLGATPSTVRWSQTGDQFALIGRSNEMLSSDRVFVGSLADRSWSMKAVSDPLLNGKPGILQTEDFRWLNNSLLVYAKLAVQEPTQASKPADAAGIQTINSSPTRSDWWMFRLDNPPVNITARFRSAPRQLFSGKREAVWLDESGIWSLDPEGVVKVKIDRRGSSINQLIPLEDDESKRASWLGLGDLENQETAVYLVESGSSSVRRGASMPHGAVLLAYSTHGKFVVYQTADTRLIVQKTGDDKRVELFSLNRSLDSIATPKYKSFEYKTKDGVSLKGTILLPYNYEMGKPYPMVVSVYAGSMAPSGDWATVYKSWCPHLLLLASHGFAVMVPSIPLQRMGIPSDPLPDIETAVGPAVERVVELGIADKERVGLIGYSYGGYSVFSLVTQSDRFKAAVAIAGFNDLTSFYGSMDPRYRFSSANSPLWGPYVLETHQLRMGVPPWTDPQRYIRNSPIFHADKVNTPLLIIHGTLDPAPISQAEHFFVELNRLNKKTLLVRYLGEGHSMESPANIEHMYEQIFSWFDRYLTVSPVNTSKPN